MKVCVLATSYPRNADDHASPFVHGLARALSRRGVQVVAVVPHAPGLKSHDEIDGVAVERFRYAFPSALEQLAYGYGIPENLRYRPWTALLIPFFLLGLFLRGLRHSAKADVLHVHWELAALVGFFISRIRGIPVVFTVHRLVARRGLSRLLTRWLLQRMDQLHFNSSYTEKEATQLLGAAPRGEVIAPSVDDASFEKPPRDGEFRRRWNIPEGSELIVGVGRMVEKKGFGLLIESCAVLFKKRETSAVLVLAGGGPLLEEWRNLAQSAAAPGRILLPGFMPPSEIRLLLSEAHLGVFPSIIDSRGEVETLGVAAIEALAAGLPVIASRVGGMVDVIQHEKTGLLIEPGDAQALERAIERLLANREEAARFAAEGCRHVRANFTWDEAVSRTLNAYEKSRGRENPKSV